MRILAALASLLVACSPHPGRLVVVVDTDYPVPEQLGELRVRVERRDGTDMQEVSFPLTGRVESAEGSRETLVPLSFAVAAGEDSADVRIVVDGVNTADEVVVTRTVVTGYRPGRTLVVRVFLARACPMISCPAGQECDRLALCVPQYLSPDMLEEAGEPGAELADASVDDGTLEDCAFSAVGAGERMTCAVRENGTLWCWGWNNVGQLGLGSGVWVLKPLPGQVGSETDWVEVGSGEGHTCGRRADGTVWCWGWNSSGQLGVGDVANRDIPSPVPGGPWTAISVGYRFTCALHGDGTLWCWGENRQGQIGQGATGNRVSPLQVGTETDWTSISAGGWHVCGTRTGGSLWCWGWADSGQLGLGAVVNQLVPARVGTDTNWASVAAGYWHTCGVRTDGSLLCWGRGYDGRLGLGDSSGHDTPTRVGERTDWQDVVRGGHHTFARADDGSIWGWGANSGGQLGLGDFANRDEPTMLTEARATVSGGGGHSCALDPGGALYCFGGNWSGALGVGDTFDRATPVRVRCPAP